MNTNTTLSIGHTYLPHQHWQKYRNMLQRMKVESRGIYRLVLLFGGLVSSVLTTIFRWFPYERVIWRGCGIRVINLFFMGGELGNKTWTIGYGLALTRMMLCFLGWMSLMSFIAVYPEIFLMHATLLLLIYGVVFSTSTNYDYPPLARNVGWLGFTIVLITMLLLAAGAPIRTIAHLFWHSFFYSQDDYTAFCQIVLLCSTAGTILLCFDAVRKDRLNAFEFIVLMLLSTCSMLFLISAYDLIAMYLSIELQSLCFYVIAAYNRNSEFATEAGLKYLILGAFASGILLFGCSMIYGSTGGTQFDLLAEMLTGDAMASFGALRSGGIWMGILCLSVGFLFKITAVPFRAGASIRIRWKAVANS